MPFQFKVTWSRRKFPSDFATCYPVPHLKCNNSGSKADRAMGSSLFTGVCRKLSAVK